MIEDVAVEIRAALRTNLPGALNTEDAAYSAADIVEFGEAIVLEDVADRSYFFEQVEEIVPNDLPAVFILTDGDFQDIPWMTSETHMAWGIEIVAVLPDTDPRKATRRLWRTMEAIRRVLTQFVEGTDASEPTFQVDISRPDFDPRFRLDAGGFARTASLRIVAHEVDGRP